MAKVIQHLVLNKSAQTWLIVLALTGILIMFGNFVGIWRPSEPLFANPFSTLRQETDFRSREGNFSKPNCAVRQESDIRSRAGNLTKPNSTVRQETDIREPENRLPPGIVAQQTDLYLRRLWGKPSEDLPRKPKYLVTFAVGARMKYAINRAVAKFSDNFTVMLFHYDESLSEWAEFEWSRRAVHVTAGNQTKWWFAKRFLHPHVVAPYDYIFVWDEDLGVDNFDAEEYLKVVKRHGLQISQPALDPNSSMTWLLTKRKPDVDVHKTEFVEIMAPVFSRGSWKCVWKMIQNDLVHAWGLDFALSRCVSGPSNSSIGVVDSQWVMHKGDVTLGRKNISAGGRHTEREAIRLRSLYEWDLFKKRFNSTG